MSNKFNDNEDHLKYLVSFRLEKALKQINIHTVTEASKLSKEDFFKIRNLGKKSWNELQDCIQRYIGNHWYTDNEKPYLWHHRTEEIDVICHQNEQIGSLKCVWVGFNHDGRYVSNYFSYCEKEFGIPPLEFALLVKKKFITKYKVDG